jgi:hypothetical protein
MKRKPKQNWVRSKKIGGKNLKKRWGVKIIRKKTPKFTYWSTPVPTFKL